MKKRGELTTSQIVGLTLTIGGFAVVLIFVLVYLDVGKQVGKDACSLSVLTRATANTKVEGLVPLKCTTEKICLTYGKDCIQFIGEKEVAPIILPEENDKAAIELIEAATANALFDCWKIMGQGKLNLFGAGKEAGIFAQATALNNLFGGKSSCTICSRVAIQDEVIKKIDIEEIDINHYMEETLVPGSSLTYLETFTDRQVRNYPKTVEDELGKSFPENRNTNEIAIIFMQILTDKDSLAAAVETGAHTGGAFVLATKGIGGLFGIVVSSATGIAAGFQTFSDRQLAASYCAPLSDDFGSSVNLNGCTVVTGMNYHNVESINEFCSRIEGNP